MPHKLSGAIYFPSNPSDTMKIFRNAPISHRSNLAIQNGWPRINAKELREKFRPYRRGFSFHESTYISRSRCPAKCLSNIFLPTQKYKHT